MSGGGQLPEPIAEIRCANRRPGPQGRENWALPGLAPPKAKSKDAASRFLFVLRRRWQPCCLLAQLRPLNLPNQAGSTSKINIAGGGKAPKRLRFAIMARIALKHGGAGTCRRGCSGQPCHHEAVMCALTHTLASTNPLGSRFRILSSISVSLRQSDRINRSDPG